MDEVARGLLAVCKVCLADIDRMIAEAIAQHGGGLKGYMAAREPFAALWDRKALLEAAINRTEQPPNPETISQPDGSWK